MSVLIETSAGSLVIDLWTDIAPIASQNFLKLCEAKYYHGCLIYSINSNFILQTGCPFGDGTGGISAKALSAKQNGASSDIIDSLRCFPDEIMPRQYYTKYFHTLPPGLSVEDQKLASQYGGYIGMAHLGNIENANASQFFITLRNTDLSQLQSSFTIFGRVCEGYDILSKLNSLHCDTSSRPLQDIRILHTYILDDPTPSIDNLQYPNESPSYDIHPLEKVSKRLKYEEAEFDDDGNLIINKRDDQRTNEEIQAEIRAKEARSRAIVLEMTGDLPDADVKPPEEVLFVCKLNSVTRDEDLELIFSRFGKIKSCQIIRDMRTGDSLGYAFIEFANVKSCEQAYLKMDNALIDDRRIKVDFSQSVAKLWNRFKGNTKPGENRSKKPISTEPSPYQSSSNIVNGVNPYDRRNREPVKSDSHRDDNRRRDDRSERSNRSDSRRNTRERSRGRDRRRDSRERSRERRDGDNRRSDRKDSRDRRSERRDSRDRQRSRDRKN